MTQTQDRLIQCFRTVFPGLDDGALLSITKAGLESWDSLASINLMSVVEEEFDVTFDDDTVETFTSFDAVKAAVDTACG